MQFTRMLGRRRLLVATVVTLTALSGAVGLQTATKVAATTVSAHLTNCPGTLAEGSVGGPVVGVQGILDYDYGYDLLGDGDFGPLTRAAVMNFQARHGLEADGVVGPHTWHALAPSFCAG